MKNKNGLWIIGGVLCLLIIIVIGKQWLDQDKVSLISKEEAQGIIEKMYPGEILSLELSNAQYVADVKRQTGKYEVVLDEKSGEILSVQRMSEPVEETTQNMEWITKEEVEKIIISQLPGEIQSIDKVEDGESIQYHAIVKENEQQHTVVMDGSSGDVLDIKSEQVSKPSKRLTEQEAAQIALSHVAGEIDDIEVENINGVLHYFIEVESEEDDAVVEIHSITGEVLSVTWDD